MSKAEICKTCEVDLSKFPNHCLKCICPKCKQDVTPYDGRPLFFDFSLNATHNFLPSGEIFECLVIEK